MRRDPLAAWHANPANAALDDSPYDDIDGVAFYAPFTHDPAGLHDVRRKDTNAVVDIEPVTLADVIQAHFTHEEHKTATPRSVGTLARRHIVSVERTHIGKEIDQHQYERQADSGGVLRIDGPQSFTTTGLVEALRAHRVADLVHASGLPKQTISRVLHGATPDPITRKKLIAGLAIIDATNGAYIAGWREIPDKWLGGRMGMRRSDIGKIRMGTRQFSRREGSLLVASVRAWRVKQTNRILTQKMS